MKNVSILQNWRVRELAASEMPHGVPEAALWQERTTAENGWIDAGTSLSVQEALLNEGRLNREVLDGKTESAAWVAERNWVYCCDFDAETFGVAQYLNLKGVDTVAEVSLNGEHLGRCDDMFIPHRFCVTGKIKKHNRMLIWFQSPHDAMREARESFPPEWRNEIEPLAVLRKSPLDLLDFGRVTYLKVGLFEDVCLDQIDGAEFSELSVDTKLGEWFHWGETVITAGSRFAVEGAYIHVILTGPDGELCCEEQENFAPDGDGMKCSVRMRMEYPQLWWPRNYGSQPLYSVTVHLKDRDGTVLDAARRTIGFRRIEKTGDMRFRVNGREIKIWGANFAPFYGPTHNWERQMERCRVQMVLAAQANMNCIRLWGGGEAYGDDLYEWADQLGLLIWQEFFLWWGYYPETPHWRELYRSEADYHVRRLKHHPCILLWSAGNEILLCNEESHWPQDRRELSYVIFREDYASVCAALDPERPYLPTAPSGGEYPNDPREGDTHPLFYSFRHAINEYPVFPSEIAHSSIGPLRSLQRFMAPEEIWPDGYINQLTPHSYNHYEKDYSSPNQPMFACVWKRIPIPSTWWKHCNNYFASECGPMEHFFDAENPEQLVYRINAAYVDYTRNELEKMRRGKPYHAVDSSRRTQGVLLWKINDTWPQFYCTLVDYYLETHLPYYQVRRSYSPALLSFDFQDATYLWGVNDTNRIVEGSLYVCTFSPARNCVDKEITIPVRIRPGESKVLTDLDELCPIVREEVIYACLTDRDGRQISRADTVLDIERNLSFQEPELMLWPENGMLCIRANRFAYCVELAGEENGDLFGWHFEDNYFNLLPFETKRIKIYTNHTSGTIYAKAHYAPNRAWISCEDLTLDSL